MDLAADRDRSVRVHAIVSPARHAQFSRRTAREIDRCAGDPDRSPVFDIASLEQLAIRLAQLLVRERASGQDRVVDQEQGRAAARKCVRHEIPSARR